MTTRLITISIAAGLAALAVPAAAQFQTEPGEMLARADADGDGRITRAENRTARTQLFERIDRNDDGAMTSADMPRRRLGNRGGGERLQQLIAGLDADGDGRVTRSEFVDGRSLAFERADANGDGVVERSELASFREEAARLRSR